MIKIDQKSFYLYVGRQLTAARQQANISIAKLAQRSGQQYKTIKDLEDGLQRCSLHHAVWMKCLLGLDLNELIRNYQEGSNEHGSDDKLRGHDTKLFYCPGLDDII